MKTCQGEVVLNGAVAARDGGGNDEMKTARDYDAWLSRDTLGARWLRFWLAPERTVWLNTPVRRLPSAMSLRRSDRVLDIGCGCGGVLIYLYRRIRFTETMEGLDCSAMMVETGRKEIMRRGLHDMINIRLGSATKLPYPDGSFDAVLCTYVIKHMSDPMLRRMLAEIRRVSAPGGRLCLWEAAPSRYQFMQVWNMNLLRQGFTARVSLRPTEELKMFVKEAGFVDIRPYGDGLYYYYPVLPRAGLIATRP